MCSTSTPRGARLARRLAAHRLDTWGIPYGAGPHEEVVLVLGEPTANAVRHGHVPGRDVHLLLHVCAPTRTARIEVTDTRTERTPPDPAKLHAPGAEDTVTVVAGGLPDPPDEFREGARYEAPRTDRDTWHEIRHADRPHVSRLRHGDYGIHPATYVTRPSVSGGGPPWGVLRCTTARSHHLVKVPYGRQYDDANREAARILTGLADFRGAAASAGEEWLYDRARGTGTPGNHSTWNRAGNIQHMAFVARGSGR
ncbi:hypothetical protein [Streptomyces sp. YIM B13518]|uniref:beta family protein n=1 Tax=Streptomyces sp. YIM B13518 TaxID=3366316 RepID=UPI0036885010